MSHVNLTRRNRGYSFEYDLVNRFNNIPNWYARRLGGSSTGLPDIVATSNHGSVLSIECKSTVGDNAYVPVDQVERCITTLDLFSLYPKKRIIFAFKFGQKKGYKLREYFFDGEFLKYDGLDHVHFVKCKRDGECVIKYDNDGAFDLGVPYTFETLVNPTVLETWLT